MEAASNAQGRIARLLPSVANSARQKGTAGFAVLLPHGGGTARAQWISGDKGLEPFASQASTRTPQVAVPGSQAVDLARWVSVTCPEAESECTLKFATDREAVVAQLRSTLKNAPAGGTRDPHAFSSETLRISLVLPEGWQKTQDIATASHSPAGLAGVTFVKTNSLCSLSIWLYRLEATQDTFLELLEKGFKDRDDYRRVSRASITRDGLQGVRTLVNYKQNDVEMHAIVEGFSAEDLHWGIMAVAPKDQFERYASELEAANASIRFLNLHVDPKDMKP